MLVESTTRPRCSTRRYEHAEPAWGPGQRSYAWSPDGAELAWCRNEDGFGRLVIGAPGRKSARELSKGWHRGLDWGDGGIACVRRARSRRRRSWCSRRTARRRRSVARGAVGGFEATGLVEPRAVTWKSGNATVHGLLWRAAGRRGGEARRCSCSVHGGPTGQALADWNPRIQYFVQRGWTVLQPELPRLDRLRRARTAQALEGRWGERDVADVAAGIRHAVKEGWATRAASRSMGGSAGGLTVLERRRAASRSRRTRSIALYPGDRSARPRRDDAPVRVGLQRAARRAAARTRRDTYVANVGGHARRRDPRAGAAAARRRRQRRSAVAVGRGRGRRCGAPATPVERHVYEGEGHGWRRAATSPTSSTRIDAFLSAGCG